MLKHVIGNPLKKKRPNDESGPVPSPKRLYLMADDS
jgi:hypothetical protein